MLTVKRIQLFAALMLFFIGIAPAQTSEIPKIDAYFDASLGFGDNTTTGSLSWNRTHGLGTAKKFRLGYGVRFSAFGGSDLNYTTAPFDLTKNDETVDTIFIANPLTMGLNAVIHIQYQFSPKLLVGFNIDALGVGFGSKSDAQYLSPFNSTLPTNKGAKPSSVNVLLGGDNDLGQLKSEFYVAYAVSEKVWLRGGYDFTFSEYTTDIKLADDNDRFRNKASMFFLAVSFHPFSNNQ
jgi:hypothetical protein